MSTFTLNLATTKKTVFGRGPMWRMLSDQVVLKGEDATLNFRESGRGDAIRHQERLPGWHVLSSSNSSNLGGRDSQNEKL